MKTLKLWWLPDVGHSAPDGALDSWFSSVTGPTAQASPQPWPVGRRAMITRARLGLVRGEIDALTVLIDGVARQAHKDGTMDPELYEAFKDDPEYAMVRELARRTSVDRGVVEE